MRPSLFAVRHIATTAVASSWWHGIVAGLIAAFEFLSG
jgi:hypothetical protein